MKTEDVFIGNICKCTYLGTGETNAEIKHTQSLLYRFGISDAWFYSPKYHKVLPTKPTEEGSLYVSDLKQFNYNNIQSQEKMSKLQIYLTYRKYLKDLIDPRILYIGDIRYQKDPNNSENDIEIMQFALLEKLDIDQYYYRALNEILCGAPYWSNGKYMGRYVENVRQFNYDNIQYQENVTREEAVKTYNRFYAENKLSSKNN